MDEVSLLLKSIVRQSVLYSLALSLLLFAAFRSVSISAGVLVGTAAGLIGFYMIVLQTRASAAGGLAKNKGTFSYFARYFLYGIIFALSAYLGADILAMLAGFLLTRLAVYIYAARNREESGHDK